MDMLQAAYAVLHGGGDICAGSNKNAWKSVVALLGVVVACVMCMTVLKLSVQSEHPGIRMVEVATLYVYKLRVKRC